MRRAYVDENEWVNYEHTKEAWRTLTYVVALHHLQPLLYSNLEVPLMPPALNQQAAALKSSKFTLMFSSWIFFIIF